jgi:hypothetical protein
MGWTCAFCGVVGKLSGEHVFGDWLNKIGLDNSPTHRGAGPLNRSPRSLGMASPFKSTVREVCVGCNNGWMSAVEAVASRVLTPMILGKPGAMAAADQVAIAAWVHKTALVGMLVSSDEERAKGYGLPVREYRDLFASRPEPTRCTRFWIGRYQGYRRLGSIWVTPMVVMVEGLAESETPQAYVMTVILGEVILQGVRFTTPGLEFEVVAGEGFIQIWPSTRAVDWPPNPAVDDDTFVEVVSKGLHLTSNVRYVALRPWRPATDLPESGTDRSMVKLPTPCGRHHVLYPGALVRAARRGVFHYFMTACECEKAYLVKTQSDGAHFKAEGSGPEIEAAYEALLGDELVFQDEGGQFVCKRSAVPDHAV